MNRPDGWRDDDHSCRNCSNHKCAITRLPINPKWGDANSCSFYWPKYPEAAKTYIPVKDKEGLYKQLDIIARERIIMGKNPNDW